MNSTAGIFCVIYSILAVVLHGSFVFVVDHFTAYYFIEDEYITTTIIIRFIDDCPTNRSAVVSQYKGTVCD